MKKQNAKASLTLNYTRLVQPHLIDSLCLIRLTFQLTCVHTIHLTGRVIWPSKVSGEVMCVLSTWLWARKRRWKDRMRRQGSHISWRFALPVVCDLRLGRFFYEVDSVFQEVSECWFNPYESKKSAPPLPSTFACSTGCWDSGPVVGWMECIEDFR